MQVLTVPLSQIAVREDFNPRTVKDNAAFQTLAMSIQANGLMQPLIVRSSDDADQPYVLIGGHRRLAACESLGFQTIAVSVVDVPDDRSDLTTSILENTMRENLTIVEEAAAYRRLLDAGYSERQVASELHVSSKHVRERLAVLALPASARNAIAAGKLSIVTTRVLTEIASVSVAAVDVIVKEAIAVGASARDVVNFPLSFIKPVERDAARPFCLVVNNRLGETVRSPEEDALGVFGKVSDVLLDAAIASGVAWRSPEQPEGVLHGDVPMVVEQSLRAAKAEVARKAKDAAAPKAKPATKSQAEKQERLKAIADARKAANTARDKNHSVWADLTKAPAVKFGVAEARLVARALLDPFAAELARGAAVMIPKLAVAPQKGSEKWTFDVDSAPAAIIMWVEGGKSSDEVLHRALMVAAAASSADFRVYPPSGKPSTHRLEDSWLGQVSRFVLAKHLPAGRRLPKIASWSKNFAAKRG